AQAVPQQVQLLGTELPDGGVALPDGGPGSPGFLTGVADVSAHYGHVCAVTADGNARCGGNNDHGQLGDLGTARRDAAIQVTDAGVSFVSVSVGGSDRTSGASHSCAAT